jgi:hypothetical protein
MIPDSIGLSRNPEGIPIMKAGGGRFTNTYYVQTVLRPAATGYSLKQSILIRTAGHLACARDQAIVPVETGDVIVVLEGTKPINDANPYATIKAYRIVEITDTVYDSKVEQIKITHAELPTSVIEGASLYHNREGSYFCYAPEPEG